MRDIPVWARWLALSLGSVGASFGGFRLAMGARVTEGYEHLAPALESMSALLLALSIALLFFIPAGTSRGQQIRRRLRNKWVTWRIKRKQAECLASHGEEIRAWEQFYEAATRAVHYILEVENERLPIELAWPEFLRQMPAAVKAAEVLPEPRRQQASQLLIRIKNVAEKGWDGQPAWATPSSIVNACYDLGSWMSRQRIDHFLSLYRRCGLDEPSWTHRITTLSKEELAATSLDAAALTPPADPPSTTAPASRPPSSPESSG